MERYSRDLIISVDDFRRSGWKPALASCVRQDYPAMWQSLSSAARAAIETGSVSEGKALWLLADACSMILTPSSPTDPFGPFMNLGDTRTSLPSDFLPSDIELFSLFVEEVDNIWLKARLADLVWLLSDPKKPQFALTAIDAYRRIPLDADTWLRSGHDCWERAISLTRMLGAGAGNRLGEIESAVISAFEATTSDDGFFSLGLADLLLENRFASAKGADIANKLESFARHLDSHGEIHLSREFFSSSAKWFQQSEDIAKATEMTVFVAEAWYKEAVSRVSSDRPSHLVAASLYEKAIQTYRTIPRIHRTKYGVDERIIEIHHKLSESGKLSLGEMAVIRTPDLDITDYIDNSRNLIRGKPSLEALASFANIYSGAKADNIRELSIKMFQEHPLQALFSATHVSRDGRVVAKRPSIEAGDIDTEDARSAIWAEMVKLYCTEITLVVQGLIWPALEILILEHRFCENDFVALANNSPIVPIGRERLFGRGLFAGYDKDFVVSLHMLVPQIEHLVRFHLKVAGEKTSNLDEHGVETENGLSALLELPKATQIFGPNFTFELKALFCDPFGPNFRNEHAHGLLEYANYNSAYSVYAWWLSLKMVFNPFWNAKRKAEGDILPSGKP